MAYTLSCNLVGTEKKTQIHRIYSQFDRAENDNDATVCGSPVTEKS